MYGCGAVAAVGLAGAPVADLDSIPVGGDTVAVGWLEHAAEMPRRIATTESFLIGELLARCRPATRGRLSNEGQPRFVTGSPDARPFCLANAVMRMNGPSWSSRASNCSRLTSTGSWVLERASPLAIRTGYVVRGHENTSEQKAADLFAFDQAMEELH